MSTTMESSGVTDSTSNSPKRFANDLSTEITVDGESYSISSSGDEISVPEECDLLSIETPCIYCDTKLQLQYSGEIPSLISCSCPNCENTVTVAESDREEDTSMSLTQTVDEIQMYHLRRTAFYKGLQSDPVSKPLFMVKSFVLASMIPGAIIGVGGILLNVFAPMQATIPTFIGLGITIFGLTVFSHLWDGFLPLVGIHLLGLSGRPDMSVVHAFFEGNEYSGK